jgi:hypothetical protein
MKIAKLVALISAFLICAVLGQQIISLSMENQDRKTDYAEINNIKYGLFSINQWKRQLSDIINAEVADFDPKGSQAELKPLIEQQLTKLIDTVDERMRAKNKETFKGRMKQAFINSFVDMKDIKAGIPQYADEILKLMEKPSTKRSLKSMVADKVEDYFEKTFEDQDLSAVDRILHKYNVTEPQAAKDILDRDIAAAESYIFLLAWILIGFSSFYLWWRVSAGGP